MDRLIAPYTVALALADVAPATGTPAYATDGNPAKNTPATQWPAYQYNALQEELMAIIAAANITPDRTKNNQVAAAITALLQSGVTVAAPDSGTVNALAVTLTPAPTVLSAGMQVTVLAVSATNTGATTLNVNGLGALPIQGSGGTALQGGELVAGFNATFMLNVARNAWILIATTGGALPVVAGTKSNHAVNLSQIPGVRGSFKNLSASASGGNSNVSVSADELMLESAGGTYSVARAVTLTINSATSGANGLDTGSLAASTWYSAWVIGNGTTVAGLLSLSSTAPTLPAGYMYSARVGWIRTDGTANKYPLSFVQLGAGVQYKVAAGSNVPNLPALASGVQGNVSTPTWVQIPLANFAPPTSRAVTVCLQNQGANSYMTAAPNGAYGGSASLSNPPPVVAGSTTGGAASCLAASMQLESQNIYCASNTANSVISLLGWEDNL
ncbi:MAG: hypothetical protein KUL86_06545 [Castellaniella sp.]|nr:hypothetical protein [Castellaniella sp.]